MNAPHIGTLLAACGRTLVFHITRAASLPDIAASGALLAASQRRAPARRHGWGANDSTGAGLVCLSLVPSWGILNSQFPGEEAAILGFDVERVGNLPGARISPVNTAKRDAGPFLRGEVDPLIAVEAATSDEHFLRAELLVPGAVPLGALKLVVLSDREALRRWETQVCADLGPEISEHVTIRACARSHGPRPRFPDDHSVTAPRTPVVGGVDQRVAATRPIDPASVREIDLEDVDTELSFMDEEPDGNDEPDLYEALYGEGRDAHLSSIPEHPDDEPDFEAGDPWC